MSPPICHRTLGPMVRSYGDGEPGLHEAYGYACIGSACAMWVREVKTPTQTSPTGLPLVYLDDEGDPCARDGGSGLLFAPTGRGWCADNLRREPWADPATPAKAGAAS